MRQKINQKVVRRICQNQSLPMSTYCFTILPLFLAVSLMNTAWNRNLHKRTKRKSIFLVCENGNVRFISFQANSEERYSILKN